MHHAHDGEQHVAHRRQQRTDENVEHRAAHGSRAGRDADHAGDVLHGKRLGDDHADRIEPAQAHDRDQAEDRHHKPDARIERHGLPLAHIGREDTQRRHEGHEDHHRLAGLQRRHAAAHEPVGPDRGEDAAHGAEQERQSADILNHVERSLLREPLRFAHAAQVSRQPEAAEIPDGVADQTDQQHAPERARRPQFAPREGPLLFAVVPRDFVLVGGHRDGQHLLRRILIDQRPCHGDHQTYQTGHDEDVVPRQEPGHPRDDQRRDDRSQRTARRTETVGRGAVAFLEPERDGHDLSGEDRRLGQSEDAAADGEFDDVGRKAAADAGQRPSDDTSQHHLLRTEAVHQNARYGIHDGVTDQEYVDDPRVLEVFDAEMGQDFGFEDRQQLAVEVVADDCDENRRHNIPTTLVRVLK